MAVAGVAVAVPPVVGVGSVDVTAVGVTVDEPPWTVGTVTQVDVVWIVSVTTQLEAAPAAVVLALPTWWLPFFP